MACRFIRVLASSLVLNATFPLDVLAQTNPAAIAQPPASTQPFSAEQLDALVASIALYPDDLLTQLLMASTFPLEIVAAARWLEDPAHKSLSGDALAKALEAEPWDPSVKSVVPFSVVLATMNSNLTWLQQLGYAFATQQADVFAAVQRLRRLAQANDKLQSSPQQVVSKKQVMVEPPTGSSQPPNSAGGDCHPADAVEHRLRAELQSDGGVRLVVAVPVVSAVLRSPAARLLFRHRAGHWTGIRGRRRGCGRAMGLGEPCVGWRLRQRQRQPVQQHQREPGADRLFPMELDDCRRQGHQFLSRTERTGRPSRPFASLRTGKCSKAPHPRRRSWGCWQRRWRRWSRWDWGRREARRYRRRRRCGSSGWGWGRREARWPRRCRRRSRCGSSGSRWWNWRGRWGWWRRQARRPRGTGGAAGAGRSGGIGGAGRPGGPGGVGGMGGAGRPGGAFGDMSGGRQAGQYGQRGAQSRSAAQRQSFGGGGRGAGGGARRGGGRSGGGRGGGRR